ncbi:MAG: hypothetical protein B6244_12650 [Candidatus Cloacimonetes bacterium 4572_55]|nr:MAG: hypothetical protein B6244_12650 [Candidatus Cloacimonetes bacterium 4572_55]
MKKLLTPAYFYFATIGFSAVLYGIYLIIPHLIDIPKNRIVFFVIFIAVVSSSMLFRLIHSQKEGFIFVDQMNSKRKQTRQKFTKELTSTIDLKKVLDLIVNTIYDAIEVENVSILLLDEKRGSFRIVKSKEALTRSVEIPVQDLIPDYRKGQTVHFDVQSMYTHIAPKLEEIGFDYCFPLEHNKNLLGTLNISRKDDSPLSENDVEWLGYIIDMGVVSISNGLIFKQAIKKQRIELENDSLKELDRRKTVLINTVAHELRNPLTAILSYSQRLVEDRNSLSIEKQERYLKIINDESRRLANMLTQMLDLARITSGRISMNLVEYSIRSLIEKALVIVTAQAEGKNIAIVTDFPEENVELFMDQDKVLQVMLNLLSNAIKYSGNNGKITISVETLLDADLAGGNLTDSREDIQGLVKISVSDTGIGMSKDDTDRIFDEFYRVNNNITTETRGSGLGLPICRSIVEAHGGWIWAESERYLGATLNFILPIYSSIQPKHDYDHGPFMTKR